MKKQTERLAIEGGAPVREDFLPYGKQWIGQEDIEAVAEALKGSYLTTGPTVAVFEKVFSQLVGADYGVAIANGTAALHAACHAAGIGPGDQVIVSPMTFAASVNCVLYQGGTPVFADIDPVTYNLSPASVEGLITEKTKAIIPVDFTGQPADMKTILELAERYGLIVIEDAAHSLGATFAGASVGSMAHLTTFSLHPVKHITTGEGGVITTNDPLLYESLCRFRVHGITRDSALWSVQEGPWYYEQQELGYNYRITDMQCALGLSQLRRLDQFIERRKWIADQYNQAFWHLPALQIPQQHQLAKSSWHLYVIQLGLEQLSADRKKIYEALHAEGIGVNVHYIPVHYFPYYQKMGYKKGLCPQAEWLYERILTLPLFPRMTDQDVADVIRGVNKVLAHYIR